MTENKSGNMESLIANSLKIVSDKIVAFRVSKFKTLTFIYKVLKIKNKRRKAECLDMGLNLKTGDSVFTTFHANVKGDYRC